MNSTRWLNTFALILAVVAVGLVDFKNYDRGVTVSSMFYLRNDRREFTWHPVAPASDQGPDFCRPFRFGAVSFENMNLG